MSSEAAGRGQNGGQTVTSSLEDVDFPVSRRGYDREAVDGYVSRVREVVAQLETTRSPDAAVKDALEKVGEQTKSVLASAGQSAEQIKDAARNEAEETSSRAKSDAEAIVTKANAEAKDTVMKARKEAAEHLKRTRDEATALQEASEARLRELEADTESIKQERGALLEEIREYAARVEGVARAADARFPQQQKGEGADEQAPEPEEAGQADAPEGTSETPG